MSVDQSSSDHASTRAEAFEAYDRGDADALCKLRAALRQNPLDGGLIIAEARLGAATGEADHLASLRDMLRRAPDWLDGHSALAQLMWEEGFCDSYTAEIERALALLPRHGGLWARYIGLLAGSGEPGKAADVARQLRLSIGDLPAVRLMEAHHAGMAGDTDRAGTLLATIPHAVPGRSAEMARHQLRAGDAAAAAASLEDARRQGGADQPLWALTELAWRAIGDQRHAWLLDADRMVRAIDHVMDATAAPALAGALRRLHGTKGRPLGQSVRGGTQTRGNLALRAEPEVQAAIKAFGQAIRSYLAALPPADPHHPLLAHRDKPVRIGAAWSIRLQASGFHVNHIHSEGIISSAYYVAVPPTLAPASREGWLTLGQPPGDIRLALEPIARVEPRPGRLCLFPSFLYHGTTPFRDGERITIAFDVAPGA